jgi:hypothetical protein
MHQGLLGEIRTVERDQDAREGHVLTADSMWIADFMLPTGAGGGVDAGQTY